MKKKQLLSLLQQVEQFHEPKVNYEQYVTGPTVAADFIYTAYTFGDLTGRSVVDLGCGTGMLMCGAMAAGPSYCIGVDIDSDCLDICRQNIDDFELQSECSFDLLQLDVRWIDRVVRMDNAFETVVLNPPFGTKNNEDNVFDTVVLNPPFGTKNNEGIDLAFLSAAVCLSSNVVYSLHKSSTRRHVTKFIESTLHCQSQVLGQFRYDLPATYNFHRRASVDIEVDLYRIDCSKK